MEAEAKLTIGDFYFQFTNNELHLYDKNDVRQNRWTSSWSVTYPTMNFVLGSLRSDEDTTQYNSEFSSATDLYSDLVKYGNFINKW